MPQKRRTSQKKKSPSLYLIQQIASLKEKLAKERAKNKQLRDYEKELATAKSTITKLEKLVVKKVVKSPIISLIKKPKERKIFSSPLSIGKQKLTSLQKSKNYKQELREKGQGRKKRSFLELERLIKLSRLTKNKSAVQKWTKTYQQKEKNWAESLANGWKKLRSFWTAKKEKVETTKETTVRPSYKGLKNLEQGKIYDYNRLQLYKEKVLPLVDWTGTEPNSKQQNAYAQLNYKKWRLNKEQRDYLLKQTAQDYRQWISDQQSQISYYQDKSGLKIVSGKKIIKKNQGLKLFFPEKGEGSDFHKRRVKSKQLLTEIIQTKGSIDQRDKVIELSKQLYRESPWRLRDRNLITTDKKGESWDMGEVFREYYKDNASPETKKHYLRAIINFSRQTKPLGEKVPDSEIVLNKYGNPVLQPGQSIRIDSSKPGRNWTVYKNIPDPKEREVKEIHEVAHRSYHEEEGTELEIQTWKQKKDKALCWVEAVLGESCSANQGTSAWWCLECVEQGPYHPPVLPKHCRWRYTYRENLCGTKTHSDASKQWHWSIQGEKVRGNIKGGDWGSCHIGTFGKPLREKPRGKKYVKR